MSNIGLRVYAWLSEAELVIIKVSVTVRLVVHEPNFLSKEQGPISDIAVMDRLLSMASHSQGS
jgi:hypothetical protein